MAWKPPSKFRIRKSLMYPGTWLVSIYTSLGYRKLPPGHASWEAALEFCGFFEMVYVDDWHSFLKDYSEDREVS